MKKIEHIIILGGGSSGWMTALALVQKLNRKVVITLIEDTKKGTIGVGEGTQPYTAGFLLDCGLDPNEWMKSSNASFKMGVEFDGWVDEPYFVDNDYVTYTVQPDLHFANYFLDRPYSEFKESSPSYMIAKEKKSPKLKGNYDHNFLSYPNFGAVHFSANDIIETIKRKIDSNINYVDTSIVGIKTNEEGIYQLFGENNEVFCADLFIDCSGFQSELLGKTFNIPFKSYEDFLFNDKCVVIQTQYFNPEKECVPYTKATTMNAGWRFTIPIFNRIGNGYVYSSKFISDEDAEEELRESLGEFKAPSRFIDMKLGRYSEIAHKNVCAIGLSSGFVEPLEATGLTFTTYLIKNLIFSLNTLNNMWSDENIKIMNFVSKNSYNEVAAFIWAHYYFSTRSDTPYWKEIRNLKLTDLPEDIKSVVEYYYPGYPRFNSSDTYRMFASHHWFSVIQAGSNKLKNKITLTENEKEYCKYFIELQKYKANYVIKNNLNNY